jgi:phosphohistidine phosphatase SixA
MPAFAKGQEPKPTALLFAISPWPGARIPIGNFSVEVEAMRTLYVRSCKTGNLAERSTICQPCHKPSPILIGTNPKDTFGKTNTMKTLNIFLLLLLTLSSCTPGGEVTTFILVRHAEKGDDGTKDPDLRAEGMARANRLAFMLKDTPLKAIYSTNFRRTRNTVAPIADVQNLEVQLYEPYKIDDIRKMYVLNHGGTVLVCGHANNLPWTANMLLGKETYDDFQEDEYGTVLIVAVVEMGKEASVTRVNY